MTLKELFEQRDAIEAGCPQVRQGLSVESILETIEKIESTPERTREIDPHIHLGLGSPPQVACGITGFVGEQIDQVTCETCRLIIQGIARKVRQEKGACILPEWVYGPFEKLQIVVDPRLMKGTRYLASEAVAWQVMWEWSGSKDRQDADAAFLRTVKGNPDKADAMRKPCQDTWRELLISLLKFIRNPSYATDLDRVEFRAIVDSGLEEAPPAASAPTSEEEAGK